MTGIEMFHKELDRVSRWISLILKHQIEHFLRPKLGIIWVHYYAELRESNSAVGKLLLLLDPSSRPKNSGRKFM